MAIKKGGLGRGLEALFADVAPIDTPKAPVDTPKAPDDVTNAPDRKGAPDAANAYDRAVTAAPTAAAGKSGGYDKPAADDKPAGTDHPSTADVPDIVESGDDADRVVYIDINDIKPNRDQPRKRFDEDKLRELADSILSNGVIQPLVVRKSGAGYELVAGERRWRASRVAGLGTVPCIVRDFTDDQNAMIAIVENMQREDLDPIEEATGLQTMMKKMGMTQEEASRAVGKSRAYIANAVRLLQLPEEIRQMLIDGRLSAAHGRTLAGVSGERQQIALAERVVRDGLSVRETERLAGSGKGPATRRKRTPGPAKPDDILAAEDELRRILGTKVNIAGDGTTGRLEISYYSMDELNRIIDLLRTIE